LNSEDGGNSFAEISGHFIFHSAKTEKKGSEIVQNRRKNRKIVKTVESLNFKIILFFLSHDATSP
jgi:hypothetical protein